MGEGEKLGGVHGGACFLHKNTGRREREKLIFVDVKNWSRTQLLDLQDFSLLKLECKAVDYLQRTGKDAS